MDPIGRGAAARSSGLRRMTHRFGVS